METHPLADWLKRQNPPLTQAAFAERLGISDSHLSLAISGDRGVSLSVALSIERETNGAVPAAAFVRKKREAAE